MADTLGELKSLSLNAKVMGSGVSVALPVLDALIAVAEAAQALAVTEHGSYSKDPEYWTAVRLPEFRALIVQLSDLIHGGS